MGKKKPLVSINLPTYNGEASVEQALESVKRQTYKNYEIVVVDHYSKDKTIDIVKKYTKKIYFDKRRILSSREIGLRKSKGEIILFLSCDQVLAPDLLEKTVNMFEEDNVDMIINEERSHNPRTFIEKLTDIDRKVLHEKREINPRKGVLMPSTFKKDLLIKIFKKFNDALYETITIHDHSLIYHEARKLSDKVGYIEKAVYHDEPKTVKELFSHYFSWGKRARAVQGVLSKEYSDMFDSKLKSRLKNIDIFDKDAIRTIPIIFLKGSGFKLGYYFG